MRYTVPFVSAWLVVAVFDVSISSQASNATPPGAEACAALASGKVGGARDAERDLRFRIGHPAGALRRARIGRATHRRGRQAVRDPFRTATADRVEWPVPVSRRWWQRWHCRPGCRAQHGIVSRDRLAARLRRGDNGRGPSGCRRPSSVSIRSRASITPTRRTNGPRRSHSRSSRVITAAHPIASTSSAARAEGGRA